LQSATGSYALSLHDALPIFRAPPRNICGRIRRTDGADHHAPTAPLAHPFRAVVVRGVGRAVRRRPPVQHPVDPEPRIVDLEFTGDRKSTRLNSSHVSISYAV